MTLTNTNNIIGIISGCIVIIGYILKGICGQYHNSVSISLSTHQERAKEILFRKICIILFLIISVWLFYFLLFCLDKNVYLEILGDKVYVFDNGLEGYTPTPKHRLARTYTINLCTIISILISIAVYFICNTLRKSMAIYAPISMMGTLCSLAFTAPIGYYGRMLSYGAMYNTDVKEFLIVDLVASIVIGLMIYAEICIILLKKLNNTAASIMTIYNDVPIYIYETNESCVVAGDNYFLEESSDVWIIPMDRIENCVYKPVVKLDSILLKKNVVFDKSVFDRHNYVLRTVAADYYNKCNKVLPTDGEIIIEYKFSDFVYTIKNENDVEKYSVYRNYLRDNEWKGNVLLMDSLMKNM